MPRRQPGPPYARKVAAVMPELADPSNASENQFATAVDAVADLLRKLGGNPMQLSGRELSAMYPGRGFAVGWCLRMDIGGIPCKFDLLLPVGFPWQPPRVALADPPPFLTWPHVEKDALLCLAPDTLTTDPNDPAGVVAVILETARNLVGQLHRGELDSEFCDEFLTYWSFASSEQVPPLVSLLRAEGPTRLAYVWRGKACYVFGESPDQLERWLINRAGKKIEGFKVHPAPFLWLNAPLLPREYPTTAKDLRALAANASTLAEALLIEVVRNPPDRIVAALGFETTKGPALAGLVAVAPGAPVHGARDPLLKGFRQGTVPDDILVARYFGGGRLMRGSVERADAAWIHGRGQDPRFLRLQQVAVAVIGCGSVGAPLAVALAQAGVGRLVLVDFDELKWANAGRHPLGASAIGQNKAKALAEKLRLEFPHMTVQYFDVDVDTMVRRHADVLTSCNLVICATGSWSGDGRLEAWREESPSTSVLYAWTEAHACAGHAVFLSGLDGCLRCGFGNTGVPNFQITEWPQGSLKTEPACGAVFQPYGAVELAFGNATAAQLALDALLEEAKTSTHRVWVGDEKRLKSLGGNWSQSWLKDSHFRDEGGFSFSRLWPRGECDRCRKAAAA